MGNFFRLVKVFFLSGFNVNRKKKNQSNAISFFILTLFLFMVISVSFSFMLNERIIEAGLPSENTLVMILLLAFMLNFVLSLFQLQSVIFKAKDYEFLESLPVSKVCIVSSKIIATYLINLSEDLALVLPAAILYCANGGNAIHGLIAVLGAVFISIVPILISTIIGTLSALLSARSKHSNVINILFSLIFVVGIFSLYLFIVYGNASDVTSVTDSVFFMSWIKRGILGEYLFSLYFVLFNIGGFFLVTLMVASLYRTVNSWLQAGGIHVDYDKVKKDNSFDSDINKVLLKKEWQMVAKRPQYFLNSILGPIFFLATAVLMLVFLPIVFGNSSLSDEDISSMNYYFALTVILLGIYMNSIATTSSSSISFEGKYGYEMLRCYPLDINLVIKAKLKIAIILEAVLNLVVSLAVSVILIIKGFNAPFFYLEIFLFPQLAGATLALAGMLTGLRWPKLEYENESQVLKNSAAANFLMLFVLLPSTILGGINMAVSGIAFGYNMGFLNYVGLAFTCLVYGIAIVLLSLLVKKKGESLFDKIILR